ncbi:MAG: hypothetical protein QOF35_464 [Actinomycetota bacterium]|nr:hypothetical protein [Actinomycetota bacterium]
MSRATQWEPLCGSDPVPGEPDEVARAGRRYSRMAKEIDDQVTRLKEIVSGTLQGGYVQTLNDAAEGLSDKLSRTSGRYREVGGALVDWAPQLNDFQDEAERLRVEAVGAQNDMFDNREIPVMRAVDAAPPADAEVAAGKARQGRYDDARGDLARIQARLVDLTQRRDTAAAKIADFIREKSEGGVANSGWDDFQGWMDDHHELVKGVCKVLGVIALAACVVALVVPGLNVLAAGVLMGVAVGATSASLIGHSMLASTGHGSWWDVGMDVFTLATFGAGRFLGPGIKVFGREFGGALGRLTGETKAAGAIARGNAARAPIQAEVRSAVVRAEQRLVGGASKRVARSVRLDVRTIRNKGVAASQEAFDATKFGYLSAKTKTNVMERLMYGGGDRDIATMRVEARDAAQGFSSTSKVGLAYARSNAQYLKAAGAMGSSTGATAWSVWTDLYPMTWYDHFRDRLVTKEGGDLWAR